MKHTHTPGPWDVTMPGGQTAFNGRRITVTANGSIIADLDWNTPAENQANANLIAAAPELLAALQAMVDLYEALTIKPGNSPAHVAARAALAKVGGGQ